MKNKIITIIATAAITMFCTAFYFNHHSDYVNMDSVTDYQVSETGGLMLYTNDGTGYYWER